MPSNSFEDMCHMLCHILIWERLQPTQSIDFDGAQLRSLNRFANGTEVFAMPQSVGQLSTTLQSPPKQRYLYSTCNILRYDWWSLTTWCWVSWHCFPCWLTASQRFQDKTSASIQTRSLEAHSCLGTHCCAAQNEKFRLQWAQHCRDRLRNFDLKPARDVRLQICVEFLWKLSFSQHVFKMMLEWIWNPASQTMRAFTPVRSSLYVSKHAPNCV